jgi:hypothetical protein
MKLDKDYPTRAGRARRSPRACANCSCWRRENCPMRRGWARSVDERDLGSTSTEQISQAELTSCSRPSMLEAPGLCFSEPCILECRSNTYPPFSQIPHGSPERSPALAVNEPFSRSQAQKNRVSLGKPARSTAMLPAQLRVSGKEAFGSGCVTWKSVLPLVSHVPRRLLKMYMTATRGNSSRWEFLSNSVASC